MPQFLRTAASVIHGVGEVALHTVPRLPGRKATDEEVARYLRHFEAIVASSDDAIISKSLAGIVESWNPAAEALFGYTAEEIIGRDVLVLFPPERMAEESRLIAQIFSGNRVKHFETVRLHKSGQRLNVSVTLSPIMDGNGRVSGVSKIVRSIDERVQAQAMLDQLHTKSKYFEALVTNSDDAIVSKSLDGIVQSWNPAAQRLFGYAAADMVGRSILVLFPPDRLKEEDKLMSVIRSGGRVDHFDTVRLRQDGVAIDVSVTLSPITDKQGKIVGVSKIARDISDRVKAEKAIWTHANFDALTGLPNRRMLTERAALSIIECKRRGQQAALMFIDVDAFKEVNDELGHAAGDELLVELARRLKAAVRDEDTVARLGGDEFIVMLSGLNDSTLVDTMVHRVQEKMTRPFTLAGQARTITLSGGVSMFPGDSLDWAQMLAHADQALYEAKGAGRHRVHYFTKSLEDKARIRRTLIAELQHALALEQLSMHYQPVVRMQDGVMVKAEALLRWNHPTLGQVSPAVFVPLAEQSGLIHDIGDFVVTCVAAQARDAQALWGAGFSMAFNVSPAQLRSTPDLIARWQAMVGDTPLKALNLVAEITEGLLLDHGEVTQNNLRDITHALGGIAIDDFGTGYSSLNYLADIKAYALKIDQSFTARIDTDPRIHVLCEAIVAMAHKLGMTVIGEGVETQGQWAALQGIGCDLAQGYLISRPLSQADFEAFQRTPGACGTAPAKAL